MEQDFIPYQATRRLPGGRVLVLAPHPDDETFGCGGAIIRHRQQGDDLEVVVLTDGGAAQPQPDEAALQRYIEFRRQETRNAAHILGYNQLSFWDIPDRRLAETRDLVIRLENLFRDRRADRIYAPSVWEIHPDHYALAEAAVTAVSRGPDEVTLVMYEVGVPLHPNLLLDISGLIEQKRQAMRCYPSQLDLQDYARQIEALHIYRSYTLPAEVSMAEGYFQISARELRQSPLARFGPCRLLAVTGLND